MSGSATIAYMRIALVASAPPVARFDSAGKNAVATALATNRGTRDTAALAW